MTLRSSILRTIAVGAAASLLFALAACGGTTGGDGDSSAPSEEGTTTTGRPESIAAPGLYQLADGRVEAVGTLSRLDLEGGFWAVLNLADGAEVTPETGAGVIAVVPNAEEVRPDVESLLGEYVAVRGKMLEGPSARMAGPEIEADSIEIVGGDSAE